MYKRQVKDAGLGRDLRNRALRERNARARGALIQGGLAGQGIAQANQAGLITQAGLQNQSFTPQAGAREAIGRGFQGEAEAEAGYQRRLGDISQSEFDRAEAERIRQEDFAREDKIREEKYKREDEKTAKLDAREKFEATNKLDQGKEESLRLLADAKSLIAAAAPAGDIVNGYTAVTDEESKGFLAGLKEQASTALSAGLEAAGLGKDRERILINYANKVAPGSYDQYSRLVKISKNLVKPLIASGILGKTSDGDIKFATETIFDPTEPSSSWAAQLDDAIARVKGIAIERSKLDKETPPIPPAQQETVGESVAGARPEGPAGALPAATSPSTLDKTKEQVDNLLTKFGF